MKITIESEALDSLKAMAQRLQEERDELLKALKRAVPFIGYEGAGDLAAKELAEAIIAKCTAKPEILE